jgi:hypothetical protein
LGVKVNYRVVERDVVGAIWVEIFELRWNFNFFREV